LKECQLHANYIFFGRLKLSFIVGALYDVNSENLNPNVENLNLGSPHLYGVLRLFIWSLAESLNFIQIILQFV
jgi:hypothetical protein